VRAFFQSMCKVLSVALIRDKTSQKSKGFGYVELDSLEDVAKALMLSGLPFIWKDGTQGFPILVKKTGEPEKNNNNNNNNNNAQQGQGRNANNGNNNSNRGMPGPNAVAVGTDKRAMQFQSKIELVEKVGEGACKVKIDGKESIVLAPMVKNRPFLTRTLALQGLHEDLSADDVRAIFEAFGPIVNLDLKAEANGKNSALVQFVDMDGAARANNQLNGHVLMESKVC